ncbi:aminotransferase class I/II-fold pyridoxal phosphate-dependent enzyme [Prochlorococcus marinus]|nr:aminotransferase class I/II-fold pyridoxal phosphate-dependent enzyme [Prochlorococcus marinus]
MNNAAKNFVDNIEKKLYLSIQEKTDSVTFKLEKVLKAFSEAHLGVQHFSSLTGYGHGDLGRDTIDKIFANVLEAEKAVARLQLVSGTHAIASSLFGVLRPGDELLSITGRPYESLEEVIGLRGNGQGSLIDFGISYEEISLQNDGTIDFSALEKALIIPRKLIFIQRSCGYTWRPSLSIEVIKKICYLCHKIQPECICFVDNCYGEFVENKEPTSVGADLIAGSLIKNLGGTISPTGGYIAGRASLVDKACCRLTAPGIGSEAGITFNLNRTILQGLFLAPQMVAEALIGADIIATAFRDLGFKVLPSAGSSRADLIQVVRIGDPEILQIICRSFQQKSPIGSFLDPIPAPMPGYENTLVMAGGTFIDGSTSEFSADAPMKPPFDLFIQGGSHRAHVKIALIHALSNLFQAGFIKLPQNS